MTRTAETISRPVSLPSAGETISGAYPTTVSPVDLGPLVREIRSLSDLDVGWDGEEGKPATVGAAETAVSLVTLASEFASSAEWVDPAVAPIGDGGVALSWRAALRSLSVFAYPNEAVWVTGLPDRRPTREAGSPREAAVKIDQFIRGAGSPRKRGADTTPDAA